MSSPAFNFTHTLNTMELYSMALGSLIPMEKADNDGSITSHTMDIVNRGKILLADMLAHMTNSATPEEKKQFKSKIESLVTLINCCDPSFQPSVIQC